jgi:hypothetical protein
VEPLDDDDVRPADFLGHLDVQLAVGEVADRAGSEREGELRRERGGELRVGRAGEEDGAHGDTVAHGGGAREDALT